MSEESFLRYRLEVVRRMPECAYKKALLAAISASLTALRAAQNSTGRKRAVVEDGRCLIA
jgi:hypothetical protein